RKVTALQEQADQSLVGLVQGFSGLERHVRDVATQAEPFIATASAKGSPARPPRDVYPGRQLRQVREVQALATRAQIQNVTNIVNSVQAAAYGQKGSVLATNNLLLAGNQLLWSLIDPVLQRAGVVNATSGTVLAAMAPLGSLLTGQLVFADRQHVRFIS